MDNLKERVSAIVGKVHELKQKRDKADILAAELEKEKGKLPASVKTALESYGKRK